MKWNGKIKRHNPNLVTLRPLWPKNALETTTPMEKDTLKYGFNLLCCGKKSDHSAASGCAKRNRLFNLTEAGEGTTTRNGGLW